MAHLIIDGYNLIRTTEGFAEAEAKGLEAGRLLLLEHLKDYRTLKGHRITVVFDAMHSDNFEVNEWSYAGIRILYSEMNQAADQVIMELARQERDRAIIVSSDKEIRHVAEQEGCGYLSSTEFEKELIQAARYALTTPPDHTEQDHPIHKRWLTKKKGPAKRAPKAKRRALRKL